MGNRNSFSCLAVSHFSLCVTSVTMTLRHAVAVTAFSLASNMINHKHYDSEHF